MKDFRECWHFNTADSKSRNTRAALIGYVKGDAPWVDMSIL